MRKLKIKNKCQFIVSAIMLSLSISAFASVEKEDIYLVQIINQLNAIKPLIVAASKEQPSTDRFKFHYVAFHDANGVKRSGLLEDINAIQKGIEEKLSRISSQPHTFTAIKGDYENTAVRGSA